MSRERVDHKQIQDFAAAHVNLKRENASKYRKQVNGLRERLEARLKQDSDFQLKRMLLSGSLAKGTALKSLNDIDVALYVLQDNPPDDMPEFISWLVRTLRGLYPNMEPSQIIRQDHSVRISFRGSGLDVDIVPISYDGNKEWGGYLYSYRTGEWIFTNISKHLAFIKKRKEHNPEHFAQVARLLKYWVKEIKKKDVNFRFKSFLLELILAHLADTHAIKLDNYVDALAGFYNFIVRKGLDDMIVFADCYSPSQVSDDGKPMRVFDPVNSGNNAAKEYSLSDRDVILRVAGDAADAVDSAIYAPTKGETIRYWQKVFGVSFGG